MVTIDSSRTTRFVRLTVTLDELGDLHTRSGYLKRAGFLDHSVVLPPTISVSDLDIITHLLDDEEQFLFYLVRRAEIEKEWDYAGDEIDLLGFYLDTGFAIELGEPLHHHLMLYGYSRAIDDYMMAHYHGKTATMPRRRIHPWWRDIVATARSRNVHQWPEIVCALLRFPYERQEALHYQMNDRRAVARRLKKLRDSQRFVAMTSGLSAVAVVVFSDLSQEERGELIDRVGSKVLDASACLNVIVIGFDPTQHHWPYSSIGMVSR